MSFIQKSENDYNDGLITLKELDEMRFKYANLNKEDRLTLDNQSKFIEDNDSDLSIVDSKVNNHSTPKDSINNVLENKYKVASDGWIIAGFIFAFLGGYLGLILGSNYAFGNYKKSTKTLGWLMLVLAFFSITITRSMI